MPSLHNTPLSCQTIRQVSILCFDDDVVVIAYQTMAVTKPLANRSCTTKKRTKGARELPYFGLA